jgi:MFS family permease
MMDRSLPLDTAPAADPSIKQGGLYAWLVVFFLMVLLTSSFIDRTIVSLLVRPIRKDLALTDTEFSYLTGMAFVVMYSLAGIPLGWIADLWSRRLLIAGGVAVWSLMTASCGLANSFWRLFVSRIGVGIGEATLSPCSYSLISEYFPAERLAKPLSVFALGIPIGSGLALIIGGSVIDAITAVGPVTLPIVGITKPWQSVFLIVGLPGLILAVLAIMILREPRRHAPASQTQAGFMEAFAYMIDNLAIYATLALGIGAFAIYALGANVWLPSYLQRVHGFTAGEAGRFLGISVLVFGILGSVSAGWLADALTERGYRDGLSRIGMIYAIGMFLCGAIGPIVPIRWLSLSLVAFSGFFSLTWAGVNVSVLQTITPIRMRSQVSAIYLLFTNIVGLGFGPTMIAASTDYLFKRDDAVGYSLTLVGTGSMALTCLILWMGRREIARRLTARKP